MLATEIVNFGIELISLALAEECRKILETRKKRRPRRWWVQPWTRRREQLGASTQLLVELAAEDSDSYRNHLRMSEAQLDFLLQKVSPLIQKADTFLRPALLTIVFMFAPISFTLNWGNSTHYVKFCRLFRGCLFYDRLVVPKTLMNSIHL
jgi:hypothetical protein